MSPISEQLLLCGKKGSLLWEGNMPAQAQHSLHIHSRYNFDLISFCIQYNVLWKPIFSQKISESFLVWLPKLRSYQHGCILWNYQPQHSSKIKDFWRRHDSISEEVECVDGIVQKILKLRWTCSIWLFSYFFFDILLLLSRFNIILFPSSRLTYKNARNTNWCIADCW